MRNKTTKISPNNTMPCRTFLRIELSLDVLCYVLLDCVFLHRFLRCFNRFLLHVFGHINGFYLCCIVLVEVAIMVERWLSVRSSFSFLVSSPAAILYAEMKWFWWVVLGAVS